MTLHYLLDTNIVSNAIAKHPDTAIVRRLDELGRECAIGAPVWHELVYGCGRLPHGKRRIALEQYLEDVIRTSFPILPYDMNAATWLARERARLESAGRLISHVDGVIAAIAQVNELVLVTENVGDFSRFKELKVEDWSGRKQRN